MESKNKQWRKSGSTLSYKEWIREELNNGVHGTIARINSSERVYSNFDGGDSGIAAANNYKPYVTGSVLGINKWVIAGGGVAIIVAIGVFAFYNNGK